MANLTQSLLIGLSVLALAASPSVAKSDKAGKKAKNNGSHVAVKCPPGLAKKSPRCVPPGQAKTRKKEKRGGYHRGDQYAENHPVLRDYDRYGLPRLDRGKSYYRIGDNIITVNDDTRLVLDVISVLTRLRN